MRLVKFIDVPVSENRDILFEPSQRIIGVAIINQGTNDVKIAMGSHNAFKVLEAGSDVAYGNINGGSEIFYLTGNLRIAADGFNDGQAWSSSYSVVYTVAVDVTETEERC